jgi:hypothetical protein
VRLNVGNCVFYSDRAKGCKKDNWGEVIRRELSSAREAEKRWRYSSIDGSVVGYSAENYDVSREAEESPLLRAVTKQD